MSRNLKVSKFIFYILLAVLPLNLGLHFIRPFSYVGGLLSDYLVPTIFFQDLVCGLLVIAWVLDRGGNFYSVARSRVFAVACLLVYALLLSSFVSPLFIPTFYLFLRWVLYILVALYTYSNFDFKKDSKFLLNVFCLWLVFLGVLAVAQFLKQGAIFNNYLVLGEQPYSSTTALIDKESFFGRAIVPSYGLFRHPNAFAGYLVVVLVWILFSLKNVNGNKNLLFTALLFGIAALFFTFSYFGWLAFIIIAAYILFEKLLIRKILLFSVATLFIGGLLLNKIPLPTSLTENPSVYKRAELLTAGYKVLLDKNLLFGAGLNMSTVVMPGYLSPVVRMGIGPAQPTHNVFVLLAIESGLIGAGLFIFIVFSALRNSQSKNPVAFISLLAVIILSSFDHYFITIQQDFLLMWIIVGICLQDEV